MDLNSLKLELQTQQAINASGVKTKQSNTSVVVASINNTQEGRRKVTYELLSIRKFCLQRNAVFLLSFLYITFIVMKRRHEADSTGTTAFKQTKSDTTFDKKVNTDNNSKFKEPVSSIKVDVKDELKGEVKNDGFEKKENDEFNNENNGSCSTDTVMNNIFNGM